MFNWNPCPSWSPLYYVSVRRKLFKFNFFIRNSFSRHHIKNKSFNYIQNFNEYFDYLGEFPFVTNGTCVLLRDRKRLLQLSRCIDYHRLFRYRFPPIFVYLVALSTLQGLETYREAGLSSFFFFFLSLPLLYSFPPLLPLDVSHLHRNENIPIWWPSSQVPFCLWSNGRSLYSRIRIHVVVYLPRTCSFSPCTFALYPVPLTFFRLEDGINNEEGGRGGGGFTLCNCANIRMYSNVAIIAWFRNLDQEFGSSCFHPWLVRSNHSRLFFIVISITPVVKNLS